MQFEWTVFFGDAADAEARVYVLATPIGDSADFAALEGLKITGRVEGPKCRYSHTLPARIPVRHRGARTSDGRAELVGEAIVPDPNFWTPELPFLYRATVEVRRGEEVVATYEQDFGIRPLGVIGKRLVFCGKTWVPRGVRRSVVVGEAPLALWRETATVMVVDDPDEELCKEASEIGVVLFARFNKPKDLCKSVRSVARFASVGMIMADRWELCCVEDVADLRSVARNVIIAIEDTTEPGLRIGCKSAQVQVILGYPGTDRIASFLAHETSPSFVQRNTGKRTLIDARAACDALQADLAGKCDPAGYIV
jgi:hypothetical protein